MRFARTCFSQDDGEDVRPVVPEEFIEECGRRHVRVGCGRRDEFLEGSTYWRTYLQTPIGMNRSKKRIRHVLGERIYNAPDFGRIPANDALHFAAPRRT